MKPSESVLPTWKLHIYYIDKVVTYMFGQWFQVL